MTVSMRPEDLHAGAATHDTVGTTLGNHAQNVAGLASLRTAYDGVGVSAWTEVEAMITGLHQQLQDGAQRNTKASGALRSVAGGLTNADTNSANGMR